MSALFLQSRVLNREKKHGMIYERQAKKREG